MAGESALWRLMVKRPSPTTAADFALRGVRIWLGLPIIWIERDAEFGL
jgi:hypothetical protein